jgi:hypothetical protein
MATQDWSPSEIHKAKQYFLHGLPIKNIAEKLGRTPSSINKALTRFGIRTENPRYTLSKNILEKQKKTNEIRLQSLGFDRQSLRKQLDNWVSFWKVCSYLEAQNICFYERSKHGIELDKREFIVNDKVYSARQLLLMANKIRVENDHPAFLVDGLSW